LNSLSTNSILSINRLNATSNTTFYNLISLSTYSTLSINNLNGLATTIYNKTNFTNLYVSGASTVLSSLNVSGNTTLNNATTINSSLNVAGDINTSGLSVFGINTSLSTKQNNLTFNYPLLNSSNTISLKYDNTKLKIDALGKLTIIDENKTNFSNLIVSNASTLLSSLNVSGFTSLYNNVTIISSLNISGNTTLDNITTINSSLTVSGNTTLNNATTINSSLNVVGNIIGS
jgi:hypothetical protein